MEEITDWLRFGAGGENRLYTFAGGYYYVEHGRALLLEGKYAAVTGLFAWLLQSDAFANHLMFSIQAHIYMAAANMALGRKAKADTSLHAALRLALPDKLYMPFAESFDVLGGSLEPACREHPAAFDAIRSLAEKLEAGKAASRGEAYSAPPPFGLTSREYETARLAAVGYDNREIAEKLFVSVNTVKTHLKTAYRKTGTASRPALKKLLR